MTRKYVPPDREEAAAIAADLRVVHMTLQLGREQFLSFGDGSVRVYASDEPEHLDPRLLLGAASRKDVEEMMPTVFTVGELKQLIKEKRGELDGGEYLVRLTAAKVVFPGYVYTEAK